jgi:tRNA-dihydrouridine synthase A
VLNGGITSAAQVREWLPKFDGVMLGRQAYQEPYLLAQLEALIYGGARPLPRRETVAAAYADYMDRMLGEGHRLQVMLRHVHGLYAGLANARSWRRYLSENAHHPGAGAEVLRQSLAMFDRAA